MKHIFLWSLMVLLIICPRDSSGYDEEVVHPAINEESLNFSVVDDYLRTVLGWPSGIKTEVYGMSISKLLREGGTREDDSRRFSSHFHDPLRSWYFAGHGYVFYSNLVWSQLAIQLEGDTHSWQTARENYFQGFATNDKHYFSETFLSLGQLTHLLADMAVPAHVRDDMHLFPDTIVTPSFAIKDPYEKWAQVNIKGNSSYLRNMDLPVSSTIFSRAVASPIAPFAISALWDQNIYEGASPNPALTRGTDSVGLAEYVNANFFSHDTVFRGYPHPAREDTNMAAIDWLHPEAVDAEDGVRDQRLFIRGEAGGPEPVRLAAVGYLSYDCLQAGYYQFGKSTILDDKVHADYASLLIPRAVGYSTALLNYFFSGSLELAAPEGVLYAIADGSERPQQFTGLKAAVKLATPGEQAQAGELVAIARYRLRNNYQPDLSADPPTPDSREAEESRSISAPVRIALDPASFSQVTFDFRAQPIPVGITDLWLDIVFKGELGGPIALGRKDLNEPLHYAAMNSTDRYYSGRLYSEAELRELGRDPLPAMNFPVSYSLTFYPEGGTPGARQVLFANVPPGSRGTVVALAEGAAISVRLTTTTADAGEQSSDFTFLGVVNQGEGEGWRAFPPALFRGVWYQFLAAYFVYDFKADDIWSLPWPELPEKSEVAATYLGN